MTVISNISDVPESGVYFQQGAIVQLVVQMLDVNTGEPVQLQLAQIMTISLEYPDETTIMEFPATLYTDGSDGRMVYTTRNNGLGQVDLFQVGLYKIQGQAMIGGVALPPSSRSDFYVQANANGGGSPVANFSPNAIILFDSNGVRYAVSVNSSGQVIKQARINGPQNALQLNALVMKDSTGIYWTIGIDTSGNFTKAQTGAFPQALSEVVLLDENGKAWVTTVNTNGDLEAA